MSKIEELLQKYCPDGVESKSIGSLITRKREKAKYLAQKVDVYAVTNSSGIVLSSSLHEKFDIFSDDTSNYIVIRKDEFAYNPSRLNVGSIGCFEDEIGLLSPMYVVFSIKNEIVNRSYLMYLIRSNYVRFMIDSLKEEGARFRFDFDRWDKIYIPLPPLEVQKEIVKVLDSFSSIQENLEQELEMRRKEYEYYREKLMTFGDDYYKKIKEVADGVYAGATPSTKVFEYWDNGTIPWMSSGEVHQGKVQRINTFITRDGYNNSSTKMVPINSVVIALAGQGKTRGTVALTKIELCTNQSLCAIVPKKSLITGEFLYLYLKTQYSNLRILSAGDGNRGGLNLQMINGYKVPVPSLKTQQQIVEKLDKFEAIIDNIEQELSLRKKQYEYYREKLLSFK